MSLKIAIVGTGLVAQHNYIPHLASLPDVSLAFYNRTTDKALKIAQQFPAQVFTSLRELLAWQPDSVFVLTRETDRFQVSEELIKLHPPRLFFEKPLVAAQGADNVTEKDFYDACRLLTQARDVNCSTAMIFNYRFFDQVILARRIIQEKNFGPLLNISAITHYACYSHTIDLIHYFAGPVQQLTALRSQQNHSQGDFNAPDRAAAFITHNDASGSIIATASLPWKFPLFELGLNFTNGRIHLRDLDGDLEVLDTNTNHHQVFQISRDHSRWNQYAKTFEKSIDAYLQSIRENQPPPIPGLDGLRHLQFEAALARSLSRGCPVILDRDFPLNAPEDQT